MYLTAKNAGQKTFHTINLWFLFSFVNNCAFFKQNLTDMSCRSMKKWQRCHRSRERRWFWLVLKAWADAAWRTDWWSSIPPDLAPPYHVRHAWFWSVYLNSVVPQHKERRKLVKQLTERFVKTLHGGPVTMSWTATPTTSPRGQRWRWTWRLAGSWSTASMMATCMAPRLSPSMRWWPQDAAASWMSTHR